MGVTTVFRISVRAGICIRATMNAMEDANVYALWLLDIGYHIATAQWQISVLSSCSYIAGSRRLLSHSDYVWSPLFGRLCLKTTAQTKECHYSE